MKYIKTYEKYEKFKDVEYVIFHIKDLYLIDKIHYFNDDTNIARTNYYYYNTSDTHIKKSNYTEVKTTTINYLDNVIYSSNNINDCYEYLKTIIKVNKYNL